MKEINKLVDLVTHGLKSNFDVIDLSGDVQDPGKEQLLFNGVLEGNYQDDEIAAEGMYQSDIYDQRFRMLKSRLRHKLYDLLYHLDFDQPDYSHTIKVELECKEYVHKAQILNRLGELGMSDKQLNKAITLGEENQLTEILIDSYHLKRDILSQECKPTEFGLTLERVKELRILMNIEDECDDIFLNVRMLMTKSIHSRNTSHAEVAEAASLIEGHWKSTQSINIFQQYYQLTIWSFLLNENYAAIYDFTQEAVKIVSGLKINPERFDLGYNSFIATRALLSAEKFKEGYAEAKIGFKHLDKSTEAWFAHSETYFLLAVHNKDYALAKKILDQVLKNPNYARASESTLSRWKIFRIYLNFAGPSDDMLKRVRFSDVHDAADFYFIESKGYYMTLPLLEFIHGINKGRMDIAEAKLDEAENYFYKYLNEPGKNPREKQFYKMIKALKASDYDVEKTKAKTVKYAEKLREKTPIAPFSDFEIIPYEDLWETILKTVETVQVKA